MKFGEVLVESTNEQGLSLCVFEGVFSGGGVEVFIRRKRGKSGCQLASTELFAHMCVLCVSERRSH